MCPHLIKQFIQVKSIKIWNMLKCGWLEAELGLGRGALDFLFGGGREACQDQEQVHAQDQGQDRVPDCVTRSLRARWPTARLSRLPLPSLWLVVAK